MCDTASAFSSKQTERLLLMRRWCVKMMTSLFNTALKIMIYVFGNHITWKIHRVVFLCF